MKRTFDETFLNDDYISINSVGTLGFSYLMKVLLYCKEYPELIERIKNYKEQINYSNSEGKTALMVLCEEYKKHGSMEIINELISLGADLNKQNKFRITTLMSACMHSNCSDLIIGLIKAGSDLNILQYDSKNALMILLQYYEGDNILEIIDEFIKFGIDLNQVHRHGFTVLMMACSNHIGKFDIHVREQIIRKLIEKGADVNIVTESSWSALDLLLSWKEKCFDSIKEIMINLDYVTFSDIHNMSYLIDYKNDSVIEKLYYMHKYHEERMLQILPKLSYQERKCYYNFRTNMTQINDNIIKHRMSIYEKPNNIISLCGEISFLRKHYKFDIPDKLKFLFDIKDENDCMNKINFYL